MKMEEISFFGIDKFFSEEIHPLIKIYSSKFDKNTILCLIGIFLFYAFVFLLLNGACKAENLNKDAVLPLFLFFLLCGIFFLLWANPKIFMRNNGNKELLKKVLQKLFVIKKFSFPEKTHFYDCDLFKNLYKKYNTVELEVENASYKNLIFKISQLYLYYRDTRKTTWFYSYKYSKFNTVIFDGVFIKVPLPDNFQESFILFKEKSLRDIYLKWRGEKLHVSDIRISLFYNLYANSPNCALSLLSRFQNIIFSNLGRIIFSAENGYLYLGIKGMRLDYAQNGYKYKKDLKLLLAILNILSDLNF